MNRQWKCYPTAFLDPAIVMSIQICKFCIFVHRVLLKIHSRRINNMSSRDSDTIRYRLITYYKKRNCFLAYSVYLSPAFSDPPFLIISSRSLNPSFLAISSKKSSAFSFDLHLESELSVIISKGHQFIPFCSLLIFCPCILLFHFLFLSLKIMLINSSHIYDGINMLFLSLTVMSPGLNILLNSAI